MPAEVNLIYYLLLFLVVNLQSIAGVGILVLGTPFFLILHYDIVKAIFILLPISILTSFLNIIYFKLTTKKKIISLNKQAKKYFFFFCLPAVFAGILLLRNFHDFVNFKILVATIIFITVGFKHYYSDLILDFSKNKKKIILFFIGLIHGITNSGGTMLSIFILTINNNLKKQTRYELSFFYFFLALLQYLIFLVIFKDNILFNLSVDIVLIVLLGVLFGNFLAKYIELRYFKFLIELLAITSAIFLIANS
jgi:uncharacterized membrane protein YfcA